MKRFLTSAAFLWGIAAGGSALAADLPQPAPLPQAPVAYIPTVAPVYNWGGIYFGVNGGYGFGKSQWTAGGLTSSDFDVSGFLVGGTIGANFQADAFVFGIEGDFDGSWLDGTSSDVVCTGTFTFGAGCETKNNWLSTVRGRVGYAADRVLFYGTAGGAFGNISAGANGAANSTFTSKTVAGWTAGAGVEAAFADNWTARLEYLFVDFSNATFNNAGFATTVKLDANLIRLGVDYKFR